MKCWMNFHSRGNSAAQTIGLVAIGPWLHLPSYYDQKVMITDFLPRVSKDQAGGTSVLHIIKES